MPPRIQRDPTNDVAPPDSVIEAVLPSTATAAERTTAVQAARAAWDTTHAAEVAAWNAQVDADAEARRLADAAAETDRLRIEAERLEAERKAEEEALAAAEAKRPKFDIDVTAEAPAIVELQAPASARDDLRKGKWVAFHMFTPEVCREDLNSYQQDQDYKFAEGDDGTVIMRATRRSIKVAIIPDRKLTYEQWSSAIPIYLRTIKDVGWPDEVVDQMNTLY